MDATIKNHCQHNHKLANKYVEMIIVCQVIHIKLHHNIFIGNLIRNESKFTHALDFQLEASNFSHTSRLTLQLYYHSIHLSTRHKNNNVKT